MQKKGLKYSNFARFFAYWLVSVVLLGTCTSYRYPAQELWGLTVRSTDTATDRYNRKDWKHWIDADHDCQNTREEVLIREAQSIEFADAQGCKILRGIWVDPYSGQTITSPSELDVDHMVPLHDAHKSGGALWNAERKQAYANYLDDPRHLRAVRRDLNRDKGDKSPDLWLPPSPTIRCSYVRDWLAIKQRWQLSITPTEADTVRTMITDCGNGHALQ